MAFGLENISLVCGIIVVVTGIQSNTDMSSSVLSNTNGLIYERHMRAFINYLLLILCYLWYFSRVCSFLKLSFSVGVFLHYLFWFYTKLIGHFFQRENTVSRPERTKFFSFPLLLMNLFHLQNFKSTHWIFIFSNYGQTFLIPCFTSHKLVFYLMIYSCYRLYQTHNGLGHKYLILVNLQYLLEVLHAL